MAGEKPLAERIAALQQRNTPPQSSPRKQNEVPARRPGGQALKDRIARFEAAGGTPVPKAGASFGLAAPLSTDRKVSGGLIGNRIPSAGRYYVPRSRSASPTTDLDSVPSRSQSPEVYWQNAKFDPPTVATYGPSHQESGRVSPLEPPFVLDDEADSPKVSDLSDAPAPTRQTEVPAILLSGPSEQSDSTTGLPDELVNGPTEVKGDHPLETPTQDIPSPMAASPIIPVDAIQSVAPANDALTDDQGPDPSTPGLALTGPPLPPYLESSIFENGFHQPIASSSALLQEDDMEKPSQDSVALINPVYDGNIREPLTATLLLSLTSKETGQDNPTNIDDQSISSPTSNRFALNSAFTVPPETKVPSAPVLLTAVAVDPPSNAVGISKASGDETSRIISQPPRERSTSMEVTRPPKSSNLGGSAESGLNDLSLVSSVQRSSSVPSRKVTHPGPTPKTRPSLNVATLPSLFGDDEDDVNYVGGWASVITTNRPPG
ncbi:hypothetical protein CALVIDRAFT_594686 [Calocera viscosa TUFC12733]|uniref:Uncharacterized protein n=1 Tax=Calocera viscosa (strain TUFC12733) TaxID=1330018 RepID=A0A167RQP4_CALVF|nr:hypothetical protein CALVIDRAFT_594686 [Calocera viscosa TUFC12733]